MLLSLGRYVLFGMAAALAAAAGGVVAPAGGTAAQPQPTLVISPASGPCDATVEVKGSGFVPGNEIPLDLAGAHSGVSVGRLAVASAGPDGEFSVRVTFGPLGCEVAARDTEVGHPGEPKDLGVFAGYDPARESILTRAVYRYTTTAPSIARALPATGDGSAALRGSRLTAVSAALAGVGASASALPQAGQGATSPGMDIRPLAVVALLLGVLLFTSGFVAARRRLR
jgi:hypothetical protein